MTIDAGVKQLASRGLNIFGSCSIRRLPPELLAFFPGREREYLGVVGHGGGALWENLRHPVNRGDHPIDRFTVEQVRSFAAEALKGEIEILFPGGPVTLPLQRLGRLLNLARPSILGIDMHAQYGLWFAYRCVFVTAQPMPEISGKVVELACDTCKAQPCRAAGPAGAREACPVAAEHRYSRAQIDYHLGRVELMLNSQK